MSATIHQISALTASSEGLIFVFAAAVAVAGLFVASLAYRGYRRNESRPMLYLAVGIGFLTAVPAGANYGLSSLTGASDAAILLAVTIAHLVGVLAVLYALTRA